MPEHRHPEVPPELEPIRRLVNTFDVEDGTEKLGTLAAVKEWLENNGLPAAGVSKDDLPRLHELREALRSVLLANNGGPADPAAVAVLAAEGRAAQLHVAFDASGTASLQPAGSGMDAVIALLLAGVERAQVNGTWERLKACPAHDCRWAFYDHSRNRSRTWCDMAVCGNRAKARSYRARTGA